MDLVDRYLQAVQFWLPKRQKSDIIAELSEDIHSQIEDKESGLGRKLDDRELEEILKRYGSPLTVATRYLPQRTLIGPALFPLYRFVLGVLLLGCVVPRFLLWVGILIASPSHRGVLHMENMGTTVLYFAFFTTVAFAIVEWSGVKVDSLVPWNPRQLPPVRDPNRIPRINSTIEIGANLIFIGWFVSLFWPRPVMDFYGVHVALSPVWQVFFWSYTVLAVANLFVACFNLLQPQWSKGRAVLRLMSNAAGAILFVWLMKSQVLMGISTPGLSPAKASALTAAINYGMSKITVYAVVFCLIVIACDIYRILRVGKRPMSSGLKCLLVA